MNQVLSMMVSRLTKHGDIGVLVAPGGPGKVGYVIQIVDEGKFARRHPGERMQRDDAVVA
jgi:hypothetical protein